MRRLKISAALPEVNQSLSFVAMNNFKVKPESCKDFENPVGSAAPKTGDMMMGPPQAKFYEAVTITEQTFF
ncbi:hypothetical protein WJX75_003833 [Coccomyxa subellipsoidea]|uniref:Uncharacterized protein n=1 Tax=Coccomyxa subellipsoidea TaxID=248742 RepID=A0ABR2YXP1_9CHLO